MSKKLRLCKTEPALAIRAVPKAIPDKTKAVNEIGQKIEIL